jgi:hypothetical protein
MIVRIHPRHVIQGNCLNLSIGVILVFKSPIGLRLIFDGSGAGGFALKSTLEILSCGHPLDIPGIMLWVVIMGMGIDYGIYYVCSYQRYHDERHPFMSLIRLAIFLSAATTLVGFGALALANHVVLKSIGLVSLLGIGYSLIGTFTILLP